MREDAIGPELGGVCEETTWVAREREFALGAAQQQLVWGMRPSMFEHSSGWREPGTKRIKMGLGIRRNKLRSLRVRTVRDHPCGHAGPARKYWAAGKTVHGGAGDRI